nr:MAG TPA: hypothetical protein [Caudoviricetes sp.]
MRAAVRKRQDVMHLGRLSEPSGFPAHLAERMRGEEQSADPAPAVAVALPIFLRPSIAFVLLHGQPLVLRAITLISFYESGAAGIAAWLLRFARQQDHLVSRHQKSLRRIINSFEGFLFIFHHYHFNTSAIVCKRTCLHFHAVSCLLRKNIFDGSERAFMKSLHPARAESHLLGNRRPRLEIEVAKLQDKLLVGMFHLTDDSHGLALRIHQTVDVLVDLALHIDNLGDGSVELMHVRGTADRFPAKGGRDSTCELSQVRKPAEPAVYSLLQIVVPLKEFLGVHAFSASSRAIRYSGSSDVRTVK